MDLGEKCGVWENPKQTIGSSNMQGKPQYGAGKGPSN